MPRKIKIEKESILQIALNIVRKKGAQALNARTLAEELGCSTQPIFSNYGSMEEVKREVIARANHLYERYLQEDMQKAGEFPYKASGKAYIRFAREERELFKLLFMRDRSKEETENTDSLKPLIQLLIKQTGLSEEDALLFHLEMWVCVHGIATMVVTSYLQWNAEMIDRILTDAYLGARNRFGVKE